MSATSKPKAAKPAPQRIEHPGLLDVRGLKAYFKLSAGWVHLYLGDSSQREHRISFLLGARPFDPWRQK